MSTIGDRVVAQDDAQSPSQGLDREETPAAIWRGRASERRAVAHCLRAAGRTADAERFDAQALVYDEMADARDEVDDAPVGTVTILGVDDDE